MESADTIVPGFDAAGIAAHIKKSGDPDLALIASRVPCRAAAVFTRNAFPARLCSMTAGCSSTPRRSRRDHQQRCANACTGVQGDANARATAEAVELAIGASDHSVFVMSTGVIGVQLPMDKLLAAIPAVTAALCPDGWADAARAIMTTDTRPKLFTHIASVAGQEVRFYRHRQRLRHDPQTWRHCSTCSSPTQLSVSRFSRPR